MAREKSGCNFIFRNPILLIIGNKIIYMEKLKFLIYWKVSFNIKNKQIWQ